MAEESAAKGAELARLESKLGVELLWLHVLSILKGKEMHGYALRREIQERFGFKPGQVSAYVVLYKMEAAGLVRTTREGVRRVYRITPLGKRRLDEARHFLEKRMSELF